MRIGRGLIIVSILIASTGCATNKAFDEGKRLIAEGKIDTGLASLEKAAREDPDNLEIRAALVRQREAIAARLQFDADNARSSGDLAAAEQGYRHVLEISP